MLQFFKDVFNARRNAAELEDVLGILDDFGIELDEGDTVFDGVDTALCALDRTEGIAAALAGRLGELERALNARDIAGPIVMGELIIAESNRRQLINDVTAALEAVRAVNTPNGTTRKIDRMLTEALAAQPQPPVEESQVPADENGIKDLERDAIIVTGKVIDGAVDDGVVGD